jgi:ADP-ribose pyrophosphatase YjhB (NUDIX family)
MTHRIRTALLWLLNPKFLVGVTGLVLDEEGRVLLLRHTYRRSKPWGLPGGGLRPRESLEDCLRREIREETGLEVEIDALLSVAAHFDRRLVDMIFLCKLLPGYSLAGFRANSEVTEARYFPPDELPEGMTRGQRKLIGVALRQAAGEKWVPYKPEQGDMP